MIGLRTGRLPRFVKQYADLHGVMLDAARRYAAEVAAGDVPGARAHVLTWLSRRGPLRCPSRRRRRRPSA